MVDIYTMSATPHPILLLGAASCVPLACTHGLVISLKVSIDLYFSFISRRHCAGPVRVFTIAATLVRS